MYPTRYRSDSMPLGKTILVQCRLQYLGSERKPSVNSFHVLTVNVGWLVGFGVNGPLRQYFSLYRAVSQREGERGKKG